MFEQQSLDKHHSLTYLPLQKTIQQLDTSQRKDSTMRKKMHQLMSQNFELKETISSLQTQIKKLLQNQLDLKSQLKIALQEITTNDEILQQSKLTIDESLVKTKELEEALTLTNENLTQEKTVVANLLDHNQNLQTEASLNTEIKLKYQMENNKLKIELQHFKNDNARLIHDNAQLSQQISKLLEQIQVLEQQIQSRREQIEQYQSFVLSKISQAKCDPQLHEKCLQERDRWYCKYLKYKEKSRLMRVERDRLLEHLSMVSAQVGSNSMRRYVQ